MLPTCLRVADHWHSSTWSLKRYYSLVIIALLLCTPSVVPSPLLLHCSPAGYFLLHSTWYFYCSRPSAYTNAACLFVTPFRLGVTRATSLAIRIGVAKSTSLGLLFMVLHSTEKQRGLQPIFSLHGVNGFIAMKQFRLVTFSKGRWLVCPDQPGKHLFPHHCRFPSTTNTCSWQHQTQTLSHSAALRVCSKTVERVVADVEKHSSVSLSWGLVDWSILEPSSLEPPQHHSYFKS